MHDKDFVTLIQKMAPPAFAGVTVGAITFARMKVKRGHVRRDDACVLSVD